MGCAMRSTRTMLRSDAMKKLWIALLVLLGLMTGWMNGGLVQAQQPTQRWLAPIGGGYADVYAGYCARVVSLARNNQINILVLGMTYSSNAQSITEAERQVNLRDAEERRFQVEQACQRAAPEGVTSRAVLAPIFTRSDALDEQQLAQYFPENLTAIFFLGGDQKVAMQVIAGTPLEAALQAAYERGVAIGGTSAGSGLQAATMLADYNPNFAADNALDFGAPEVWNTAEQHGLLFGVQAAILDQHFQQRGRIGRLLNALALPNVPHVGIGVDAYTGVWVADETRLQDVFGLYVVTILDEETYHAAQTVRYVGKDQTLSLRNVLVHLLAPGDFSYDLQTRQHSLQAPPTTLQRDFADLRIPEGAGTLFLGGNLTGQKLQHPAVQQFLQEAGGDQAQLLIVSVGYPSERSALNAAEEILNTWGGKGQAVALMPGNPLIVPPEVTGVWMIGKDQSLVDPTGLLAIQEAWRAGKPLLMDNAAAALAGSFYSAHPPTPRDAELAEVATQASFLAQRTNVRPGIGLVSACFEPQLLNDNRVGRMFSLAYNHPELVTFALMQDAALVITTEGAQVLGENAVLALDLRQATLALGENQGFVIANGLLDVFAPGDVIEALSVEEAAQRTPQPTPELIWPTATTTIAPTMTQTAQPMATESSQPTATVPTPSEVPTTAMAEQPQPGGLLLGWGLWAGGILLVAALAYLALRRGRRQG
jgi:cyanophycinase